HTKTAIPSAHPRHAFKSIPVVATPGNHQFNPKARGFCSSLLEHPKCAEIAVCSEKIETGDGGKQRHCNQAGTQSENNHCSVLVDVMSWLSTGI
ncbi:hypothetical protein ACCS37_12095, partial [Rhizobium ruizarguesonis]